MNILKKLILKRNGLNDFMMSPEWYTDEVFSAMIEVGEPLKWHRMDVNELRGSCRYMTRE
ncbi:MAG: hypothetical protein NPIRA01_32750 [Nitrospirales bacterium]|nr:MAG: hypothetical protein NPIRA01_32750 [Nitrospirales bacterium]